MQTVKIYYLAENEGDEIESLGPWHTESFLLNSREKNSDGIAVQEN